MTRCCPKCKKVLPHTSGYFNADSSRESGLSCYCRDCCKQWHALHRVTDDPVRREKKRLYDKRRRSAKRPNLLHYYGITLDEFNRMLEKQGGVCAVCKRPETARNQYGIKRLAVDHDHETGKVRGLLCSKCNTGLGALDDNTGRLQACINYLNKSKFKPAVGARR